MQWCFSDRFGGVSLVPYESLNVGLHVGDERERVLQNREILRQKVGASKLVFMDQIHQDRIVRIINGDESPICDAMITDQQGIGLVVMVADCIPILFYDEKHLAIGVAHAGREGTRLGISAKCVQAMKAAFGSQASSLRVWMGPSIQACCYEVGSEVTQGFENFLHVRNGHYYLDLQRCNQTMLVNAGVLPEHIDVASACSCCDERFFSYRREKRTGRFAGVICL